MVGEAGVPLCVGLSLPHIIRAFGFALYLFTRLTNHLQSTVSQEASTSG